MYVYTCMFIHDFLHCSAKPNQSVLFIFPNSSNSLLVNYTTCTITTLSLGQDPLEVKFTLIPTTSCIQNTNLYLLLLRKLFDTFSEAKWKSWTQDPKVTPWGGTLRWSHKMGSQDGALRWDPRVGTAFMTQHNPYPFIFKPHFLEKILHLIQ